MQAMLPNKTSWQLTEGVVSKSSCCTRLMYMHEPVIDRCVDVFTRLEILYLGGNRLCSVPVELGHVTSLVSLVLSDNQLTSLPRSLTNLHRLQSLSLHNNQLATLPPDIIRLPLVELSLRNNPLVVRFVEELTYDAPSLLELAGRCVKTHHIHYSSDSIPATLVNYLDSAHSCVNPRCNGTCQQAHCVAL